MRLPYVPDPPPVASEEEAAVVARIRARRAPRPLQPLDLALLHSPPVADGWNAFLGAVRTRTAALPADLRELAIARVAVVNRAWYEWAHHAPLAEQAGVSKRGLEVVRREGELLLSGGGGGGAAAAADDDDAGASRVGDDGGNEAAAAAAAAAAAVPAGLTEKQWAVLCYTDEMTRHVQVRDETFARLRELFGEREIVEITATIAAYNCVSRFLVALDVGERNGLGPDAAH